MPTPLTIVAYIEAKKDKIDLVRSELLKLIEPTRKETGCLQYDLHEDHAHPQIFIFFENWESRDLWQAHLSSDHIQAYLEATEEAIDVFRIHEMIRIDS